MSQSKKRDEYNLSMAYSDSQLAWIMMLRQSGNEWEDITKKFNRKFGLHKSVESIRHAHRKFSNFFEMDSVESEIKHLKEIHNTKRQNSKTARENRQLLDYLSTKDELLEDFREIVQKLKKPVFRGKWPKFKFSKKKKKMTLELMLSDLHYGKETKQFNLKVCRERIRELTRVLLAEVVRCSDRYNVHRIILALLGDIIESQTMHGLESARGCEFGNPRQVQWAIDSLFFDLILPVARFAAKRGIVIDIPAVTGNHDREDEQKTYHNPGEENLTWIVYNMLKLLVEQCGLKNIRFYIPTGSYVDLQIYRNTVLYEHGDNTKASTREAVEKLLNKRQTQLKKIIDFYRMGHYHEYAMYGRGRIIINESLPGPDSYSDVNGYDSHAGQTLNYYVETRKRPTCFFRSFPIFLGGVR